MSVPGGPLKRAIQDNTTGDRPVKRHDALGLSASSQTSTRSTNSGVNAPEVTFHASQASIQSEPVGAGPFDPSVLDTGAAESRNRAQSAADGSNGLSKVTTAGVGDAGANGNETDAVSSPRAKAPLLDTFRNAGRLVQLRKNAVSRFTGGSPRIDAVCEACRRLDLNFDRFVIPVFDSESSLTTQMPSFDGERKMGTYEEIKRRHDNSCSLCGVLIESLRMQPETFRTANSTCSLVWTVDGMRRTDNGLAPRLIHKTRRLQILWREKAQSGTRMSVHDKSYIVLAAPGDELKRTPGGVDSPRIPPYLFLGRLMTSTLDGSDMKDSFDLAKKWLNICTQNHINCRPHSALRLESIDELINSTFFMVVDVDDMKLTYLPKPGHHDDDLPKYAAMSYTWPRESEASKKFTTKKANVAVSRKKGGIKNILEKLPQQVQDAINLTRKLGIQWLWVDSLCIMQDEDDENWDLNADIMDLIYGNAEVTICAADKDAELETVGLKALWATQARYGAEAFADYRSGPDAEPIRLLLSHPSESYIAKSRWDRRGWTLQERLLSLRCLIFVQDRMYFQCRATTFSEDIYSDDNIAGWSVELLDAPAQLLDKIQEQPIEAYKQIISMYTRRELSKPKDILHAFSGISNLVKHHVGDNCEMLWGLPNSHFDWALLWTTTDAAKRRVVLDDAAKSGTVQDDAATRRTEQDSTTPFPSWTWCGWEEGEIVYENETIVGAGNVLNLHEWTQRRTWIEYYIRDGKGKLRLVWDPLRHKANRETDEKSGFASPADADAGTREPLEPGALPKYDLHCRPFNKALPTIGRGRSVSKHGDFKRIVEEFQLKVVVLPPGPETSFSRRSGNFASQPWKDTKYLQFFTWSAMFYLVAEDPSAPFCEKTPDDSLQRFGLKDRRHTLIGSCLLDKKWAKAAQADKPQPQEFIAMSYAQSFRPSELNIHSNYAGPESQSDWQLYNVLMLDYDNDPTRTVAIRAGLGKVYKAAFAEGCKMPDEHEEWVHRQPDGTIWKEIVLA